MKKKLIEVALPLEKINAESAREKSIRHGHPSTLHLWWARRPLAAARAVIWASLVDDPSSHPDQFPTEEDQNRERQRLFKILEDLVVWENSNDPTVLQAAKDEIMKSTNGNPPPLLDPFAGGGAIPLEAQRLGLKAHAHDLNPVAVMINKAMIEIPPRFAGMPPVNPDARQLGSAKVGSGAKGLAEDVRYYGEWMKQEAFKRIGHLYPKVKDKDGTEHTVIAWIWARTVKCPNPACGCEMPLANSLILSKKKQQIWANPFSENKKITFALHFSGKPKIAGTVSRKGAVCSRCGSPVAFDYIREEMRNHRCGSTLIVCIGEGNKTRIYIPATTEQEAVANVPMPKEYPEGKLAFYPGHLNTNIYGLDEFYKLFTNRQLTALTTFSNLVKEAQHKAEADAVLAGLPDDHIPLADGGSGALAYGQAMGVYLSFVVDKLADRGSSICSWDSSRDGLRNTFGRQAIPMVWDYAEGNPFSNSSGCFDNMLDWVIKCLVNFPSGTQGAAEQHEAQIDCGLRDIMVSTDPPYYDNIGYSDLSDYFYVWLRSCIKNNYPDLFRTMLAPKDKELIATPYRHEGSVEKAKKFFEDGMSETCRQLYLYTREDIPVTIYYAYKQSDSDANDGTASSGWETMLSAIIQAGFSITGTWPMRTEMANRSVASGTNALASSIVLVCRKRAEDAPVCTRRNFINELKRELRPALLKLQSSNIAPVDLAQSAIGPGMGVFSKYSQVLEADGKPMSVRSALKIINQELDVYFNEQESDLDSESRFCVDLYSQYAFNEMPFGDANTLANAKNTSVSLMASHGTIFAQKGKVRLLERPELPIEIDDKVGCVWLLCQQLTYRMEQAGVEGCAKAIIKLMTDDSAERAKDLAYRLYTIAERKKWAQEAYAYNSLVVAWQDIMNRVTELRSAPSSGQTTLF